LKPDVEHASVCNAQRTDSMRRFPHQFGGSWTDDKLNRLRKYLSAYTTALKRQRFRLLYIDAFAGTGYRTTRDGSDTYQLFQSSDDAELAKGSARVALEVNPPFHEYIFVESDPAKFRELSLLREQFPDRRIELLNEDSNQAILRICHTNDWRKQRAVAFLDPYGMQVEWATIREIAYTRCIDLWYLFPIGMVLRLTPYHGQIPEGWASALDKILPDTNWRSEFYSDVAQTDLFGISVSRRQRMIDIGNIEKYLIMNLRKVFAGVAENGLQLRNSKGSCMYLLTFACGNARGAPIALRIAQDVLKA
jgi:three-Cys-motif partner protein